DHMHVRGYKEEGTITTPFDMAVLNDLDRFHLVSDTIDRLPQLGSRAGYIKQAMRERLIELRQYIREAGEDMTGILSWRWGTYCGADQLLAPRKAGEAGGSFSRCARSERRPQRCSYEGTAL